MTTHNAYQPRHAKGSPASMGGKYASTIKGENDGTSLTEPQLKWMSASEPGRATELAHLSGRFVRLADQPGARPEFGEQSSTSEMSLGAEPYARLVWANPNPSGPPFVTAVVEVEVNASCNGEDVERNDLDDVRGKLARRDQLLMLKETMPLTSSEIDELSDLVNEYGHDALSFHFRDRTEWSASDRHLDHEQEWLETESGEGSYLSYPDQETAEEAARSWVRGLRAEHFSPENVEL